MKNKVIYALLSLVIAFGLWMYVVTVINPESENTYYNIPVVLSNESVLRDKGLMITTDKEPTVTLKLRGNRVDLNKLKNSDITLMVDLSRINDPGQQSLDYIISFPGDFADNAFEVLSRSPDWITLDIVEWGSKDVDVTVDYVGSVPADYIVKKEETILDHEKVTITGPKSVIDRITQARIGVDLQDQTETVSQSYRFTLCDAEGEPVDAAQVQTNVAEVGVTVKIQRVRDVTLLLNITYGGGATETNTTVTIDPATIRVAGSERLLENLGNTLIVGSINLNSEEFLRDTEKTFPIVLPDGIDNLTGEEEVTVSIRYAGLDSKTLAVSNIEITGIPKGMTVAYVQPKVTLTVRGPAAMIGRITAEELQIRVDLSEAELGSGLYRAQVLITNVGEYIGVGVVGTCEIAVELQEDTGGTP